MNYLESFAKYMESLGVATRGQNLTIGEAPRRTTDDLSQDQWWIVAAGGASEGTDFNEWKRVLYINVFLRSRDPKCIYDKFEELRQKIYDAGCPELEGYRTVNIDVSGELVDSDINTEENKIGVMVVRLAVMQN